MFVVLFICFLVLLLCFPSVISLISAPLLLIFALKSCSSLIRFNALILPYKIAFWVLFVFSICLLVLCPVELSIYFSFLLAALHFSPSVF